MYKIANKMHVYIVIYSVLITHLNLFLELQDALNRLYVFTIESVNNTLITNLT